MTLLMTSPTPRFEGSLGDEISLSRPAMYLAVLIHQTSSKISAVQITGRHVYYSTASKETAGETINWQSESFNSISLKNAIGQRSITVCRHRTNGSRVRRRRTIIALAGHAIVNLAESRIISYGNMAVSTTAPLSSVAWFQESLSRSGLSCPSGIALCLANLC